jgi:hypothetical protein
VQHYKASCRPLLNLIGIVTIDAILLTLFVYRQDRPMDGLTSALIIVPAIVLVNIIVALVLYVFKRKSGVWLLLANCLIAPIVFTQLAKLHYRYYRQTHFTTYYFTYKQHKFEIELETDNNFYTFSEMTNQVNGSTTAFMGDYKLKNDSIVLIDTTRRPVIVNRKLIGYPTVKDTIQLNDK